MFSFSLFLFSDGTWSELILGDMSSLLGGECHDRWS